MNKTYALAALLALGGCGTISAVTSMPNPARTTDKIESKQAYEIGPFKENHQYEVTIASWSPSALGVKWKLVDTDRCSQPDSYSFTLVDDRGARSPFKSEGTPATSTRPGREGMTLTESLVSGSFDAAIGPESKYLVIEQRPLSGKDCPSIDFRWNLQ